MKKKFIILFVAILILGMMANVVQATSNSAGNNTAVESKPETIQEESTSALIEMKEKELKSIEDYNEKYGSDAYGMTAYLLNKVRIYSIPFAFLGIALAAIFQYVIGVRKLDVRDRGFTVMIAIVTVFVICQVLPLVFAIVVRGFRG